jgi:hypothetical protein
VAIIIPSATPVGAAICRELLNSNALVLGIDNVPAHETTRVSGGSHFQFLRYQAGDSPSRNGVLDEVKRRYGKDHIDFLVSILLESGGDEVRNEIMNEVVEAMESQGSGLVLMTVSKEYEEEKVMISS